MNVNSQHKILVTQTGGWIGDMVLLTPALRALKQVYPQSHVALMIRPLVADFMAVHPHLDEIIIDTKKQGAGRLKSLCQLVKRIRQGNFDLAVVLHPTSFRNALIPFLARVPARIGSNAGGRGMLLTQSCTDSTDTHEIHRYLRVLELIDIYEPSSDLEFWHTEADRCFVHELLTDCNVSPAGRIIGVNLGTTWQTKLWPLDNFAEVITSGQDQFEGSIVLTGSSSEVGLGKALQKTVKAEVINLIGKTTVMQLGALIERCDLYLTCDSGPMHIAAAVGTPTVALFGPTSPTRHRPYGEGHYVIDRPVSCRPCYKRRCWREDMPNQCMTEIRPADVVEQIVSHLNLRSDP